MNVRKFKQFYPQGVEPDKSAGNSLQNPPSSDEEPNYMKYTIQNPSKHSRTPSVNSAQKTIFIKLIPEHSP